MSLARVLTLVALCAATSAQEWTRFRGPNGTGLSQAKTIPTQLSQAHLRWKQELPGVGHSSPVLWGDKLFITTTGDDAGGFSALCLDANTGRQLWRKEFPLAPFPRHKFNSFASATPAVDAERVYLLWNEPDHYVVAALDHSGREIWRRDLGPFASQHGAGISPIVHQGKVIIGYEHGDSNVIRANSDAKSWLFALNAADGKTAWQTPRKTLSVAYSTPCLYTPANGEPLLIFNSEAHGISAVDPSSGDTVWEFASAFDKRSVSSPVIAGDVILGSCGSGGGGAFVTAVRAGESRGAKPTLAYTIKKSAPYVPTPVAVGKLAWLWSDGGILTCIDSESGAMRYQERVGGNFFGSPIWVSGRLYAVSTAGELVVVAASDQFEVLHRFPLQELCHTTPAVANERLYIRTEKHLWCFAGANPL